MYLLLGKTSAAGLSKYFKIKLLSPLSFPGKMQSLFTLFGLVLAGNREGSQSKLDISYFTQTIPDQLPVPVISSFAAIGHKEHFRKNVAHIFKFCCFTWYHFYISEKKSDRFPDAEFNVEAIGTNFKSQKLKTKKLVCAFLIVRFHFETNLIKCFLFLRKILDSWEISSESVWSRKICWFRQKNRPSISFQGYLPLIYGQNLD